ncbi:multiheme c-type cytochrome [Candidatus Uabimicrobium sp. HlEnr_7]|uniref:multiheme c-type cytochrome n=1 Tax=Candidatus Uabimicrobium helgolandensis TaxID=3095367 RepID=UPI0035583DC9
MKIYTLLFSIFLATFGICQEKYLCISKIWVGKTKTGSIFWDGFGSKPDIVLHVDVWKNNNWSSVFISKKYSNRLFIEEMIATNYAVIEGQMIRFSLYDKDLHTDDLIGRYKYTVTNKSLSGEKISVSFSRVITFEFYTLPAVQEPKDEHRSYQIKIEQLQAELKESKKTIESYRKEVLLLKQKIQKLENISEKKINEDISKKKDASEKNIPKEKTQYRNTLTVKEIVQIKEINRDKNRPIDYKKIMTAQQCGNCHKKEMLLWKQTPHYTNFDTMSKQIKSKAIFKKLGLKGSIKRNGRCSKCHFTQKHNGRKVKAVSGVSCESCHGAGKDWILIHNDRSIPKAPRRQQSIAKGMNNPVDIYLIAQTCYKCHSIPDEELVNAGGHKASSHFELVSWSQGMERHNFIRTNNKNNAKSTPQHLRVMFIIGAMLDLEYSLRGLIKVTEPGKYYDNMKQKVSKTYKILSAINSKAGAIHEIGQLLTLFKKLNMNKREHLEAGANLVTLKAKEFTKNNDGSRLASLDPYIPKNYKWVPAPKSDDVEEQTTNENDDWDGNDDWDKDVEYYEDPDWESKLSPGTWYDDDDEDLDLDSDEEDSGSWDQNEKQDSDDWD